MYKKVFKILFLILFSNQITAQNTALKIGDPGLPLILNNNQGIQQSVSFPYINKIQRIGQK